MASANRLLDAAIEIQRYCEEQGWAFYFIGGIAVQHWGEARLTRDADLTVFTGVGDEGRYVDALLARFAPRVDDAREFALRHRVLLLHASNGIPIDLALGALAFEERAASAATIEEIAPGVRLRLCGPGSLLVYKVFAGRPQDGSGSNLRFPRRPADRGATRALWSQNAGQEVSLVDLEQAATSRPSACNSRLFYPPMRLAHGFPAARRGCLASSNTSK